jgi:hypothetical protein
LLPALSAGATTTYPPGSAVTFDTGLNAGLVTADPKGNYVYSVQYDETNTYPYISITTTLASDPPVSDPNDVKGALPHGANAGSTAQVCQSSGFPSALTVSPDGNRLFILCNNDPTDYVEVWDVSQGDGQLLGSDTSLTAPTAKIPLPQSVASTGGVPANAENGCLDPIDIKAIVNTTSYGTRVFVSCFNSDTIVPIEYNSGLGSNSFDSYSLDNVISTDTTTILNAATPNPYVSPCENPGSTCPNGLTLTPDPALHFVAGGLAPVSSPVAMAREIAGQPYYQYVMVAGGALPLTWTNPDGVLGSDSACSGLTLVASTGQITGTSSASSGATCGTTNSPNGFIIRVTDGSGQFVERAFTIPIQ